MYLKPVTSVADLLFKAKTEEAYRRLLLRGIQQYLWSGRNSQTFEEAATALNNYLDSPFINDCSNIIKDINRCCSMVQREMEKEELKVVVVKNREGVPNRNGDVYFSNVPITFDEVSQEPLEHHHHESYSPNCETLTRYGQNPLNGETMVYTRVIPLDATPEQRELAERELERSMNHRIEQLRQTTRISINSMSQDIWTRWYQNNYV